MSELLKIIFPMLFLLGSVVLYHGIKKGKRLIFPDFREDFPLSTQEARILFPKVGKYQFFYCRKPKMKIFRQPTWLKKIEFGVTDVLNNEPISYKPSLIGFTRSDLRGVKAYALGEVEIPKAGQYRVTYPLIEGEADDFLSVMSYHGGMLSIFLMVWTILIGSFLTLGGLILSIIAWQGKL